ncbi:aldehyde oxidase 2-like protein [Corchorus capsularis]|uniref:Aldehyde oxidase 2-like protein n=1 Tax=Corchorus capsularis TaxID=210143 RepID=A0A1R3J5K6_COCAP|nr:aldehyde oxidase 2-like protein [Corchorus capsularis]
MGCKVVVGAPPCLFFSRSFIRHNWYIARISSLKSISLSRVAVKETKQQPIEWNGQLNDFDSTFQLEVPAIMPAVGKMLMDFISGTIRQSLQEQGR